MDAATATAAVADCAESTLLSKAENLLRRAEDAVVELRGAAEELRGAATTLKDACDVIRLATAVRAVRAGADEEAVRAGAEEEAARAGSEEEAARAGSEEEAARPRGCCGRIKAWWKEWRRSGRVPDLEAPLVGNEATVADLPAAGQESDRRSEKTARCSAMQSCALLASLTMLPYMGPDGVLKEDAYSSSYRESAGLAFSWIWFLVGLGVPCLSVRSRILYFCTRLVSRIGMLAATLLVIFYCHWSLFPHSAVAFRALVFISATLHISIFIWACFDGDM
ncbi:hypothetical protein SEVIR_6G026900v4 [Setaria viridis]|uniref:Uncharacterized protein n=1 Tax=Setaria viridis TaxID=4556 RepID=A0A4U6U2F9_SETVI|nr:uncharacterized protein LOC117860163 [Setaria viridis]TKW08425.1 hypothetical protein SEVIR_6G026900v2 [Setaria viridis]